MAKIPLYEQKIQPSGEYQSAEFDPTPIIKGFEVEAETARHMANLAETVGTQLDEFKNKSDEADYEVFNMEKQQELAQLKQQALLSGEESIDTVFENVVAPRMKEIESEVGKRGYAWNTGKYQQRWKIDSQKLAYEEFGDRLELELAEHENKIIREAEAYYKNNDWETGDAKISQLAGLVGNEKAFEQQQKGRYNYMLNQIMSSNDPDYIGGLLKDPKHTDVVSYAQLNQLKTTGLGRIKTIIQNKLQPAMSQADKLYKDGALTQSYVDDQLNKGNFTPRVHQYYTQFLKQDLALAMSDSSELSNRQKKGLIKAKKRVDNLMNGAKGIKYGKSGLNEVEDIMEDLAELDEVTPQMRSQILAPLINVMQDDRASSIMSGESPMGHQILTNTQANVLTQFNGRFNSITATMRPELRDDLYLEHVFEIDDLVKRIGKMDIETEEQRAKINNIIDKELQLILAPVIQQAIPVPVKPKTSDVTISLDDFGSGYLEQINNDLLDEFFPEQD